ncbi:patatin-like phospholipase family protein [Cognatishimia sp. SS12]|uniref:patatin-like phospholipase family protein n=1 Tax=Cognatishimia sp. SS12 TaxID=2979465 RepID=UPI00233140C5|nr:patatin-like phospholipase family protein [Cognatishimia sp. SS12]MDC0737154.1 patatin-like phospholipase family protein [Cognatishimia sp. SS12]
MRINLALQGGGAHGAFTWGVLDVLLQDPDIEIAAISGTSAGAMNGAALKAGMLSGGPEAARANLDWLWTRMGALSGTGFPEWMAAFGPAAVSRMLENSWPYVMTDLWARMTSPYAFGPFYQNPLREIAEAFQYDKVCADQGPQLFVCATNVRTGKARVFTRNEISTEAILASACLPTLFQAVEIEDPKTGRRDAYWDGGFTGNPALWPFFKPDLPDDVLIVNINPLERAETPTAPQQIQSRMNEISFNAALMGELRAISFVQRLISDGALTSNDMKDVRIHMIADDDLMTDLSVATKTIPVPQILDALKRAGQVAARKFLENHRKDLGTRGTVDLTSMYS